MKKDRIRWMLAVGLLGLLGFSSCSPKIRTRRVIKTVDRLLGREEGEDMNLITYVTDRLGHDARYAIDST